ncbi:prepilin-type N-terminal cleavage/methylation domain-containing protein [Geminocystis sp. NIES-3709]|uniref:prepilin-type N-terminal cleavage/methylation domain-containing protein n=1 Tax=Geminocystis sp. NIES-3709 TaxID=1617448 RepID=UPI0005FC8665|nr:prepilin-type N-terminal cleavage/methylation domain-containing protein [Geminocystis sp. NIES-3709]BAQ63941.1 hypothetical protein GM3709_706 [Geminocystis sp. NIES-3709]
MKGFTLFEVVISIVIVGILVSVGVASLNRSERELKEDFNTLISQIRLAQELGNKRSQGCRVTTNPFTAIQPDGGNCYIEFPEIRDHVVVNNITLDFNFEGILPEDSEILIVESTKNNTKYCAMWGTLGIMRTGIIENGECINTENLKYDNNSY